jgi:N-acetylglucosamine repressor
MKKATRQHTKDHNTRLVLRTIFEAQELSRADIARLTGLTRPTVSAIVGNLIADELVIETGQRISTSGKPPTLVRIKPDGRRLVALDLSGREFRGALVNLDGRIETIVALPVHEAQGEEALLQVYRLLELLLRTTRSPRLGLGIATPGLVDPQSGIVLRAVNLGWADLPLCDLMEDRYRLPTHIANDSHMATLAEYTYGSSRESGNLIVIRISKGIGAGIVLDGRPFYGDGYGAGEIGHVVVAPGGLLCTCGNRGCLEMTSSTRAILKSAVAAAAAGTTQLAELETITWPNFVNAVIDHDPVAVEIAVDAGRHLGTAIANLVGAYNIDNIVLTGQIAELGDILLDAVVAEMHQRVLPSMASTARVQYTTLDADQAENSIILGCSALILQRELGII